jgi:16S rRNA (uracil1498-N3)-methyltransferase
MVLPRFYYAVDSEMLMPGGFLSLHGAVAHHAINVLRIGIGDKIVLFNGKGGEYICSVDSVNSRQRMAVKIEEWKEIERESPLTIILIQAICASDKMDYIVQKSIEAGVNAIQPLSTQRSMVKLSSEKASRRLEHWNNLALAACEQCGRNRIPTINPVMSMSTWLAQLPVMSLESRLLLTPRENKKFSQLDKPSGPIKLLIGPEGGFSSDEQHLATASGFLPIKLGPRTLRTETAAIAAIAALQMRWGDY